ncbi:hypothetical protein AgCh_013658 [Apium graveolens]
MLRSLLFKATAKHTIHLAPLNCQRGMHTRNKKAMEVISKGWSGLKEVDRVIDYCQLNDKRLIPLLRGAALLVEAADMGDADAQYELAYRLRVEVRFPKSFLFSGENIVKVIGDQKFTGILVNSSYDIWWHVKCHLSYETF